MANTIEDLRAELFAALRGLNDKQNPMDIERAKAVADVAQVIVNSAKVEVDHLKVTGGESRFLGDETGAPRLPDGTRKLDSGAGYTVTRHRLK